MFGRFPSGVFVNWFAVHPDYQSHGVGRFMLTFIQAASVIGNKSIDMYLQVNLGEAAGEIYKHWGFKQIANKITTLASEMQESYKKGKVGSIVPAYDAIYSFC